MCIDVKIYAQSRFSQHILHFFSIAIEIQLEMVETLRNKKFRKVSNSFSKQIDFYFLKINEWNENFAKVQKFKIFPKSFSKFSILRCGNLKNDAFHVVKLKFGHGGKVHKAQCQCTFQKSSALSSRNSSQKNSLNISSIINIPTFKTFTNYISSTYLAFSMQICVEFHKTLHNLSTFFRKHAHSAHAIFHSWFWTNIL